jgi:hypothetical protein
VTPPPPPPPVAQAAPIERRGDFVARGVLSSGLLPNWAPGFALAGDVRVIDGFGVFTALTYLPEVRTDAGRAAFGLTAGSLGGCYALLELRLDALEGCAGAELGALHSVVYEDSPRNPGDRLWLAVIGALRGSIVLQKPWLLELGAGFGVPLIRHRFVVKGEPGVVFRPSPIVGQAFAGVGLIF